MSTPTFYNSLVFAKQLDDEDILKHFRNQFFIPQKNGKEVVYFCGNSLGLQPKSTHGSIEKVLSDWATLGVEGHFSGSDPWATYHIKFKNLIAPIVGALPHEVVSMNSLTANLHLMLQTFYKPQANRFRIITESKNFSSDIYAMRSQVQLQGLDPAQTIIEIPSRSGDEIICEEDIIAAIKEHGDSVSLVLLSSVNYYTGQLLLLPKIIRTAHAVGAVVGLDLAHAIGNVKMQLHDWDVDFAVWCSYKYLNSGPGAIGGLFVHERHSANEDLIRPAGWWGHRAADRFQMNKYFHPSLDADGFQWSNAPVISMAAHYEALLLFESASMEALLNKSQLLTGFLEYLIRENCTDDNSRYRIHIITPSNPEARGAQLSIAVNDNCKDLFEIISQAGYMIDMRAEKILRISPVPLYNSFEEVYRFVQLLKSHSFLQ